MRFAVPATILLSCFSLNAFAEEPPAPSGSPCASQVSENCTSLTSCTVENSRDAAAYACFAYQAKRTCGEALRSPPHPLSATLRTVVSETFFAYEPNDASCYPTFPFQEGGLKAAVWTGPRHGRLQNGLQILPSASFGLPVTKFGDDNDASRAIGSNAIAGVYARYSPVGFIASVHGFVGATPVNAEKLTPEVYPNPAMVMFGGGLDAFSGALSLSLVQGELRPDGPLSKTRSTTTFVQVSLDLTAVFLGLAGETNKK